VVEKVNVAEKLAAVGEPWQPKIVAELNDVEHCPLAETDDTEVVLIEPKTTLNTGNVRNERTVDELERL
jgi:hypothetical protein